jgi:uncharacterized protein
MKSLFPCWLVVSVLLSPVAAARADLAEGVDAVSRRDYPAALKAFKSLAEQGDVAAQINLGNLFMKGLGVKQNYAEAQRWFRNAAEQNERMAQTKLGILYFYGLGVERDPAEAGRWFQKAAEQGEPSAQAILGSLHAEGEGVSRDQVLAYYWYGQAAEQGNEDGEAGRRSLEEELSPGQMDEALQLLADARRRGREKDERAFEAATAGIGEAQEPAASAAAAERQVGSRKKSRKRIHK